MAGWLSQMFEKRKSATGHATQPATAGKVPDAGPTGEPLQVASRQKAELEASQIIDHAKQGAEDIRRRVTVSLRSLIDRAVTDAEQVAAGIKDQSRKEAEEEALKIINEARQKAEEIKKQAASISEKETEEILLTLDSASPAISAEARKKIQLYLLKARQEIEKEVLENYELAQSRVTRFLESQEKLDISSNKILSKIPHETKMADALEEVKEFPGTAKVKKSWFDLSLKSTPKVTKAEPVAEEGSGKSRFTLPLRSTPKTDEATLTAKAEAKKKSEEAKLVKAAKQKADKEADLALKAQAKEKAKEAKKSKEASKRTEKEAKLLAELAKLKNNNADSAVQDDAPVNSKPSGELETPPTPAEPKTHVIHAGTIEEQNLELRRSEIRTVQIEKPAELIADQKQALRTLDKKTTLMPAISTEKLDANAVFEGEIELAITVPVDPSAVTKLFNYIQSTPDMKVLYTRGSWDKGTLITVSLEKPMPFLGMISKISGLKISLGMPSKDTNSKVSAGAFLGAKRQESVRIDLVLANQ